MSRCLIIAFAVSVLILVSLFLLYGFSGIIPNNSRLDAFSKRLYSVELPEGSRVIKKFKHVGITSYAGNYCHFVAAELIETDASVDYMKKYLDGKKIGGIRSEYVPVKYAYYEKDSTKWAELDGDSDLYEGGRNKNWLVSDMQNWGLVEFFFYPVFIKPAMGTFSVNPGKSYFFLFSGDFNKLSISDCDYRCM